MDERDGKVVGSINPEIANENMERAKLKINTELLHINAQCDLLVRQVEILNKIVANQRETINQLNGFEEEDEQSKEL